MFKVNLGDILRIIMLFGCTFASLKGVVTGKGPVKIPKGNLLLKNSYVSTDNPNNPNGTAVVFFSGFSTQGGILPDLFENIESKMKESNPLVNNMSKFIMPEWPGIKLIRWRDQTFDSGLYESDPIEDSTLALVKQDMEILKELKKQNNEKLHLVGFSWGGLRAMMAYLHLSEVDRKGISLSLVDPLIPSLAVGKYAGLVTLSEVSNKIGDSEISKTVRKYMYTAFAKLVNRSEEMLIEGDVMCLIRHCIEQEEIIKKKLDSLQDKTVDIRQIALMGAKGPNGKDGLGTSEKYVEFFRNKVLPKCNTSANGDILEVMKNHSHNSFIGSKDGLYYGTDDFIKWMNQAVQKVDSILV